MKKSWHMNGFSPRTGHTRSRFPSGCNKRSSGISTIRSSAAGCSRRFSRVHEVEVPRDPILAVISTWSSCPRVQG
jgi:hypothetical protein